MNTIIKTLEANKEAILNQLNEVSNMFKLVGFPEETPRYFNFEKFDEETNKIYFCSSQRSKLKFWVTLNPETMGEHFADRLSVSSSDVWKWFKQVRTNFLIDNHPTIDAGYKRFNEFSLIYGNGTVKVKNNFTGGAIYAIDKTLLKKEVLKCIDLSDHPEGATLENTILNEYGYEIQRHGHRTATAGWLQGLPTACTVPFYYNDIQSLFERIEKDSPKTFGELPEEAQDKLFTDYWYLCADILLNDITAQKKTTRAKARA